MFSFNFLSSDGCRLLLVTNLQVAFDDLPVNAGKTCTQRREYWEKSRRLQHGTLIALWWQQPCSASGTNPEPCITFATITMRDQQQLAPREAGERPQIGVRSRFSPTHALKSFPPAHCAPTLWPLYPSSPPSQPSHHSLSARDCSTCSRLLFLSGPQDSLPSYCSDPGLVHTRCCLQHKRSALCGQATASILTLLSLHMYCKRHQPGVGLCYTYT